MFQAINEIIFVGNRSDRARVVIVALTTFTNVEVETKEMAKKLRRRGINIYAAYAKLPKKGDVSDLIYDHISWSIDAAKIFVGPNPERLFEIDDDSKNSILKGLHKMKPKLVEELCGWKKLCRYTENGGKGQCRADVWRVKSYIFDEPMCKKAKPKIDCHQKDICRKTCDEKWWWNSTLPNCNKTCDWVVNRNEWIEEDVHVKGKLAIYCPSQFICPPCFAAEAIKKAEQEARMWTALIIGMVIIILIILAAAPTALVVFLRKRRKEVKAENEKIEALQKTVIQMTTDISMMYANQKAGAEAGMGADLSEIERAKDLIKSFKPSAPTKHVSKKPTGPIKSMVSPKRAPTKSKSMAVGKKK